MTIMGSTTEQEEAQKNSQLSWHITPNDQAQPRRNNGVARVNGTANAHRRWLQRLVGGFIGLTGDSALANLLGFDRSSQARKCLSCS